MNTEFPHQPDEPVSPAPAQAFPPLAPTEQIHPVRGRGPAGETTAGHGLAVRADHRRARSRTRLGTAGHLGCHPHEESPAPRSHPGRDRLRAYRPVGNSRNRRRRDGRAFGHLLHGPDCGARPSSIVAPTTVPATVSPRRSPSKKVPGISRTGRCARRRRCTGTAEDRVLPEGHEREVHLHGHPGRLRSRHQAEVTGTFNLRGGSRYPGDKAVEKASDARCEKYFARYVGIDWDSSA